MLGRPPPSGYGSSRAASRPVGAMETLTKPFQSRVAVSLDRTGMRTSTLGRQAVGDPILVRQLRPGRSLRLAMACQVLAFIEASSRAHVAPVPPGAMRPGILHRTERSRGRYRRRWTAGARTARAACPSPLANCRRGCGSPRCHAGRRGAGQAYGPKPGRPRPTGSPALDAWHEGSSLGGSGGIRTGGLT